MAKAQTSTSANLGFEVKLWAAAGKTLALDVQNEYVLFLKRGHPSQVLNGSK